MSTTDQRPALLLSRIDVERIEDLLERPEYRSLDTTALRGELERAELVEPGAMPGDVITMNTTALVEVIDDQQQAHAQRLQQVALEPPQRPGQRLVQAQAFAQLRVGQVQLRLRIVALHQAQYQLAGVERGQRRGAPQSRCRIQGLGRHQARQLATQFGFQPDVLQRLQRGAQQLPLRRLHPACDQPQAAVLGTQHFHQQAGLAPGTRMQDEGGLVVDAHGGRQRMAIARQRSSPP